MAASELLSVAKSNYDSAIYAWEEVASSLYNKAEYLIAVKAISKLPKYGSYITFFLIGTEFLSNASEMSLYAEYTVANATIANTLCEEMCEMANTGEQLKNGISISQDYKTAAKRFTDLIVLRKNAEKQYVAFSDSMPWYYGWTDEDNKAHAQNNISKLDEMLSRYSYATS